jgi:hypothetical protein
MLCRFILPFASGMVTATLVFTVLTGRVALMAATLIGRLVSYAPRPGQKT